MAKPKQPGLFDAKATPTPEPTYEDLLNPKHECPKCGSENIRIGIHPLGCNDCGWHHLNKYQCRVCGEPARQMIGGEGQLYGCAEHGFTQEEKDRLWAKFYSFFRKAKK